MKKYKIEVEIISDTLFGSTEGSAAVDSSTRAYKNGLPYIPAKTFKGLLKESAVEVLELTGTTANKGVINRLFGEEGVGNNGRLHFQNLDLLDKSEYETDIIRNNLVLEEVLSYFTKERYQTAMKNGVAKINSLRSSRVLKSGVHFSAFVETHDILSPEELNLLEKSCLNLRRVGTNRNRGFGKAKVAFHRETVAVNNNKKQLTGNTFKITLMSPALLPATQVDANTVGSESIISGRKILGMLASAYIKKYKLGANAQGDDAFSRLFLSGDTQYSNAYPLSKGNICLPLGNHWVTDKAKEFFLNDYLPTERENYKSIGGIVSIEGTCKASIGKILEFHNSRNKKVDDYDGLHTRITGSNKGAGIFYYENLEQGQEFVFRLSGDNKDIKILNELLSNYETLRIGKSTSTNLGRIKVENWNGNWIADNTPNAEKVVLTFVSPVILKNEKGDYSPDLKTLAEYFKVKKIEPENSRLRTKKVLVFQSKIKMQLPEMVAIAPGSSIVVDKKSIQSLTNHTVGEFIHEGFGQFVIEDLEDNVKPNNLKEMLTKGEPNNDEKPILDSSLNNDSEFLRWIKEYREILEARKNGNEKGNKTHKSTTMLMIALHKNVKFEINKGVHFKKAIEDSLDEQFKSGVYSKKTVEVLEKFFGKLDKNSKEKRKDNLQGFKKELKEWITKGLCKIENDYKFEMPKVEYWLAYFNKAKIKSREK